MKATRQSLASHTSRWGIIFWRSVGKRGFLCVCLSWSGCSPNLNLCEQVLPFQVQKRKILPCVTQHAQKKIRIDMQQENQPGEPVAPYLLLNTAELMHAFPVPMQQTTPEKSVPREVPHLLEHSPPHKPSACGSACPPLSTFVWNNHDFFSNPRKRKTRRGASTTPSAELGALREAVAHQRTRSCRRRRPSSSIREEGKRAAR
jgi:hypothetical protein